jgi:acetoin:2,6-dichlorophenolindophenol oxidoreductase subunit alpha
MPRDAGETRQVRDGEQRLAALLVRARTLVRRALRGRGRGPRMHWQATNKEVIMEENQGETPVGQETALHVKRFSGEMVYSDLPVNEEPMPPELVTEQAGARDLLPAERMIELLGQMERIRVFEETAEQLYMRGMIHGTMHLSIGQEATAVGAIAALQPTDYILSTHRGHGHCLAKGADPGRMMAEFMGKETGYCRGLGGSMHIADVGGGNLGANGIVAGGLPISVGVGWSMKVQGRSEVCMVFFGDGASNEGAFHEALVCAAIWRLPIIFVCENNHYAMSLAVHAAVPTEDISERASAYHIPGVAVDGNDLLAVYEAAAAAVERARSGRGPTLIEAKTYRWRGHSKSDRNLYRTQDEIEMWKGRDPIAHFRAVLIGAGVLDEAQAAAITREAKEAINAAVAFAEQGPEPDPAILEDAVYA